MTKAAPVDLDALLGLDAASLTSEPTHTKSVRLFGKEWTLVCDINSFALSNLTTGSVAAVPEFIKGLIHPDQWTEFASTMSQVKNLDAPMLGKILNVLVEAASERPTKQPSTSPRGGSTRTSGRKSQASTDSARVVRSTS